MNEIRDLLERQARWQKTRQALTWPEKIRMAERVRESIRQMRAESPLENGRSDPVKRAAPSR
jgi:hypothetical protein